MNESSAPGEPEVGSRSTVPHSTAALALHTQLEAWHQATQHITNCVVCTVISFLLLQKANEPQTPGLALSYWHSSALKCQISIFRLDCSRVFDFENCCLWGWRNGSAAKSCTDCSFGGPELGSQHTHREADDANSGSKGPWPSSGLPRHCTRPQKDT